MSTLKFTLINIIATLLRFIPLHHKTGIIRIGNPNRNSPVFLTCNYSLTVERVKRSLREIDCFLLIANSHGINVWCASTGGHLTNHSIISVLKTSGIENLVNHRRIILPQLAAPGIEAKVIEEKTGWNIIWGPVYAKDIPAFLKNNLRKSPEMRQVKFPVIQRIEMALMWAFPFSIICGTVSALFWKSTAPKIIFLTWALPFLIFVFFPFYNHLLNRKKSISLNKYTVIFDFVMLPLLLWAIFLITTAGFIAFVPAFTQATFLRWSILSLIVILLISMDLMGSTPIYKSSLHKERLFNVVMDSKKCKGEGICIEVCPRDCFRFNKEKQKAEISASTRCIRCGACVVQCPFDALFFKSPEGKIIPPLLIRKFKLNLMGERVISG